MFEKLKKLFRPEQTFPELDVNNQDTSSPYGKHINGEVEKIRFTLDGELNTSLFEKGTLVTFTIGDRAVFSKFISR